MDFFGDAFSSMIDMREEMHKIIYGGLDVPAQGVYVVLRELNDVPCPGCFDAVSGGPRRVECSYCDGEGYQFTERVAKMAIFAGVAPVYKPSILGSGQYPKAEYGNTDPNRYTAYCEFSIYPNFERYTLPQFQSPDKLYVLKIDGRGQLVYNPSTNQPWRVSKWKILAVTPIYGDRGRVEYFELGLEKENVS